MPKRINAYVALVCLCAAAACVGLYLSDPSLNAEALRAALVFCALGAFAQALGYHLARGASGSISFIPFLAIVALSPSWIAVAAVAASMVLVETVRRRESIKGVFNIAQHTLAAATAIIAYRVTGGLPLLGQPSLSLGPFLAMLTAYTLTNSIAVSGAIAISDNRHVWTVWRDNTLKSLAYDLLSLPVIFSFDWVFVNWGATGVAVLAVPLLGVRQLYLTNWQLERTNQELLELMVAAIEARDPYTSGHSRRVAHYSKIIARAVGLGGREVERVGVAALLHDVGKIHEVFAPILRKPDRLTPEEWDIMKTHPIKSAELAQHVSTLKDVIAPLRHHHENWDGTGYPDGLAGEAIPLYSRVIMFADTIDAMTTDRPYRAALGALEVKKELERMRGRQFDPRICDLLLNSPLYYQLFEQRQPLLTPTQNKRVGDVMVRRLIPRAKSS